MDFKKEKEAILNFDNVSIPNDERYYSYLDNCLPKSETENEEDELTQLIKLTIENNYTLPPPPRIPTPPPPPPTISTPPPIPTTTTTTTTPTT